MGNCFDHCGTNMIRVNSKLFKDNPFEEKNPNPEIGLKDFEKLKILGKGALGTVFLVKMKKTSFSSL